MMGVRRWFLHNLRRGLGTAQAAAKADELSHRQAELHAALVSRVEVLEARVGELEAAVRLAAGPSVVPPGCTLLEVNGDRMVVPDDLLKFVLHTRVNDPAERIPKLMVETRHYLWCRQRLHPGDTAWDVGSNIGLFTVMMARRVRYGHVGNVHAIEASPTTFRDLQRVVAANGLLNVTTTHAAAADRPGTLSFVNLPATDAVRESSHLFTEGRDDPDTAGRVEVPAVTLDGYAAYHGGMQPRLIKIDVEGAEFLVLEGARQTIRDHHPYLCIEIHPEAHGVFDHDHLRAYLDEFGYRYTHHDKTYYCE